MNATLVKIPGNLVEDVALKKLDCVEFRETLWKIGLAFANNYKHMSLFSKH